MGSDAIANARISAFNQKSAEKKQGNNQAQSKQNKVDVTREQNPFQANKKEQNLVRNEANRAIPPSIPNGREGPHRTRGNQGTTSGRKPEHETRTIYRPKTTESWMKNGSTTVRRSSDRDGIASTLSKEDFYASRNRSSYCSGSASTSSYSEEDRDDEDGCLDDWEAMADALTAAENHQQKSRSGVQQHRASEISEASRMNNRQYHHHQRNTRAWAPDDAYRPSHHQRNTRAWAPDDAHRPISLPRINYGQYHHHQRNTRAWAPDDDYRPRNLPRISRGPVFAWRRVVVPVSQQQQPSSCPICCEDFDVTDSSFHPCPCGFQLCLFCHKTILEVDGRCPGCRKQYDSVNAGACLPVQKTRSCSKNA